MSNSLPSHNPRAVLIPERDLEDYMDEEIVQVIDTYRTEAENARRSGPSPRDQIWEENWERYWGRYSSTDKAAWQSTHVMPEAPQFVDRWAAAMREALDAAGQDWFMVEDQGGTQSDLVQPITKAIRAIMSRCANTPDGHVTDFTPVFEDQMRLGALMACCASVTWKENRHGGWVSVDSVDPREVWYDPKGRNMYRRRTYEVDKYELLSLARQTDEDGESIYDISAIESLLASEDWDRRNEKERSSGYGQGNSSPDGRKPIKIDEWLCDLVMADGNLVAANTLIVVANDLHIIRGPEENPFWHERDWLVFTPMISVPFSIYGRSYMEDWADVADAFIELTNLILDGVFTSTMRAFVANPDMLEDPTQLDEGISPNKIFLTDEAVSDVRRFMNSLDLGSLPPESVTVWRALKEELREGAKLSEIALGQMAPHSRTSATEITQVQQSGSAMIRSMARTIESRFIEPLLHLVWKTALQHMDFRDIQDVIGAEWAEAFNSRRQEFADRTVNIRVRGISGLVDRQTKLQNLLSTLQIIGQNQQLMEQFMQRMSPQKLLSHLFMLFGIDEKELEPTERERLVQQATQQMQPGQQPGGQGGQQPGGQGGAAPSAQELAS